MADRMKPGILERLLAFGRWLAQPEELPETGSHDEPARRKPAIVTWFIAPGTLPHTPETTSPNRLGKGWLFRSDPLPDRAETDRDNSMSFVRWLLGPDRPLPAPIEPATKEASTDEP